MARHLVSVDPSKPVALMWRAASSYNPEGAFGQIFLEEGDMVEEVKADDGTWTVVRKSDGAEGAVPTLHLGKVHSSSKLTHI